MSVERQGRSLKVTDTDGDTLYVDSYRDDPSADFRAVLSTSSNTIGLDVADGLALLSFLAGALGVTIVGGDE